MLLSAHLELFLFLGRSMSFQLFTECFDLQILVKMNFMLDFIRKLGTRY